MEEEQRCQAPRLCVNNCGFFGSPSTQNLCSRCYRDLHQDPVNQSPAPYSSSSPSPSAASVPTLVLDLPEISGSREEEEVKEETPAAAVQANRCLTCRKRVGLMGFKCRCGMVLCGSHRYPEQHSCGFDFKSMGKEQIAKANPVIKADKLEKI